MGAKFNSRNKARIRFITILASWLFMPLYSVNFTLNRVISTFYCNNNNNNINNNNNNTTIVNTETAFAASENNSEKIVWKICMLHVQIYPFDYSLLVSGVDFDSEDEGLFGKEQQSSGLFDKPKQPSKPVENTKSSLRREPGTLPSAGKFCSASIKKLIAMTSNYHLSIV